MNACDEHTRDVLYLGRRLKRPRAGGLPRPSCRLRSFVVKPFGSTGTVLAACITCSFVRAIIPRCSESRPSMR